MKSSWSARCVWVGFVLAIGGCQDQLDDLGPIEDLPGHADAGRSVDPAETLESDTSVPRVEDAAVTVPKDEPPSPCQDASVMVDASAPTPEDASTPTTEDASVPVDAAEPLTVSFDEVYALIAASCVGCHGAGKTLDLSTPELAHQGLVGQAAQYSACVSDGGVSPTRVVAGDPEASLLIAKLENTQSCGKQMPPKALLEQAKIDVFRAWIAAGAPQ